MPDVENIQNNYVEEAPGVPDSPTAAAVEEKQPDKMSTDKESTIISESPACVPVDDNKNNTDATSITDEDVVLASSSTVLSESEQCSEKEIVKCVIEAPKKETEDASEVSDKSDLLLIKTPSLAPSNEAQLPSLGILIVDNNADANQSSSSKRNIKDNDCIKKVSARLSMEPLAMDDINSTVKKIKLLSENEESSNVQQQQDIEQAADALQMEACGGIVADKDDPLVTSEPSPKPTSQSPSTANKQLTPPAEIKHLVKKITFRGKEVPIITQNNNGPCPLLSVLNALLLKGDVQLRSVGKEMTGGELVSVVANALIDLPPSASPHQLHNLHRNTDDAVQILDKLLTGLDVNVRFSGVRDFEFTSELCVFDGCGVNLYHGWVVEPQFPAFDVVQQLSYNQLTNNICTWRHEVTTTHDDALLTKALYCEEFLNTTGSQLTMHGLFSLGSTMRDEELAVLFRNNHFSTIYKQKDQLYQLITDQGFLKESAVWQTLTDVDASYTEFVTAKFEPLPTRQEAPPTDARPRGCSMTQQQQITTDEELAAVLQQEGDERRRNQEDLSQTLHKLGGNRDMSDAEIAALLQEDEMRRAEAAEGGRATRGEEQQTPPPAARQDTPNSPLSRANRKKKDQCYIL